MAKETKAVLEIDELDAVADRGYYKGEEILACEEAGITVTLPKPQTSRAKKQGRFGKEDFRYVSADDVYICPAGERLIYLSLLIMPSAAEILGFPTDGGQCEQSDAYGKLLQNPSVARADGINRRDSQSQWPLTDQKAVVGPACIVLPQFTPSRHCLGCRI